MVLEKQKERIIEVVDLVKRYHKSETNAVDGVSFYVEAGSFFSLLGPNGAGKTTTISILTTILSKTAGKATLDGHDVTDESNWVRNQIGVIFQNPSLDLNLTAEENIRFHVNLYGLYGYRLSFKLMDKKYQQRVLELAKVLGVEKDIFKPVKTFSGGMKRKLEIIRSLMHRPRVLFLDEPTTGLDPVSRANLWQYLREVQRQEKTTIFLTTHYLEEAEGSDYICVINQGKVVARGTPDEIKQTLIESYVEMESTNMNQLKKELLGRGHKISGQKSIKVRINGVSPAKIIQETKTPLTKVKIHNPTLEEAYVKILEGK